MLDDDKISGDAPFPEVHAPRTGVATAACPLLILWTAPPTARASASESVAHVATRSRRRVGTHLGAASCFLPAELKNEHYAAPRVAAHAVLAAAAPLKPKLLEHPLAGQALPLRAPRIGGQHRLQRGDIGTKRRQLRGARTAAPSRPQPL